jgi:hypothetical protein
VGRLCRLSPLLLLPAPRSAVRCSSGWWCTAVCGCRQR